MADTLTKPVPIDNSSDLEEEVLNLQPISRRRVTVHVRRVARATFNPVPDADDWRDRPERSGVEDE